MSVSMSGSWNISGSVSLDPVAPFVATAGATTALFLAQNQTLTNFNPFGSVVGGYTPYTYYVSSGILPPGLILNPTTGLVSGTPTTVQNSAPAVFAVQDSSGQISGTTVTVNFAVSILPVVAIAGATTSISVYQNTAITSFNPFSSVSNGYPPYTYYVSSGTLPTGVTLDPTTGIVSGTPTVIQSLANVVFAVKDSQNNQSATTATVSFTVNAALVATAGATSSVSSSVGTAITNFNPFSSVTGGFTPYTYYVSSGTLPNGITINSSTGLVSGTATSTQSLSNVVFSVKDSLNTVASTTVTVGFTVTPPTYSINYLVVGGGGGGGSGATYSGGGGGGAGQFLCGSATLTSGVTYTITAATNAAGATFCQTLGANGTSSSLSGAPIGTITAIGGGGGASFNTFTASPGASGGGGSGGWFKNCNGHPLGPNAAGTGSPGNPGGIGGPGNPAYTPTNPSLEQGTGGGGGGGGSGGIGAPGGQAIQVGPPTTGSSTGGTGGAGGSGKTWTYTGPTVFYAAGGGGGGGNPGGASPYGTGGAGGSGTGGCGGGISGGATGGYGSGGGGGGSYRAAVPSSNGGYGGIGVVILAVPTPQYPGAYAPIATTPPSAPGQTVLRWTTPGTYVA